MDPENRLLSRMNRQRLDFESLRDAMLATSGRLDRTLGGPPVDLAAADCRRRTIYGLVDRQNLASMLQQLRFCQPRGAHLPRGTLPRFRSRPCFCSTVRFVLEQARAFAQRAEQGGPEQREQRIARMFQLALGRPASAEELRSAKSFLDAGGSWPELGTSAVVVERIQLCGLMPCKKTRRQSIDSL